MELLTVAAFAEKHQVPERTIRHYCAIGKIRGAVLRGKTWLIPSESSIPAKGKSKPGRSALLEILQEQKAMKYKGGIYHRTQVELTYNSNRIEGSRLSLEQTRFIFETSTIGLTTESISVDDIIETSQHFRCIDLIIDEAESKLSERLIKKVHFLLKSGTSDSRKDWFNVGDYRLLPNEVGGNPTCPPEEVPLQMKGLLERYHKIRRKTFDDILAFHYEFETIHPFQDGNGRVGRLIMFKECLANNIVPFIIDEELKFFYYRGLREWPRVKEFLRDTCLSAQDSYKRALDYFKIEYLP
jgi:fido (protein-threonine AMPylation protein)